MKQDLPQARREQYIALIKEAKGRVPSVDDYSWRSAERDQFIATTCTRNRAVKLAVERAKEAHKQFESRREQLEPFGLLMDNDGDIRLQSGSGLDEQWDKRAEELKAQRQESLKKYDIAILDILKAETGAEAKDIVAQIL